jgi:hypothetical protein
MKADDKTHVALQTGLTISKTKYSINRQKMGNEPKEIEINRQKYANVFVEMFKHLVPFVTKTNEAETKIKVTITTGNKCYHALGQILKKIYNTLTMNTTLCNNDKTNCILLCPFMGPNE